MTSEEASISVENAKQRLMEWGDEADVALQLQIEEIKAAAQASGRKILPWGAGIAAGLGLLSLIRGRKSGVAGAAASGVSLASSLIRIARTAVPIVMPIILSKLNRNDRAE